MEFNIWGIPSEVPISPFIPIFPDPTGAKADFMNNVLEKFSEQQKRSIKFVPSYDCCYEIICRF